MKTWDRLTENKIQHFHDGKQFNSNMFKAFVKVNKFDKASFAWPKNYAKQLKDGRFPHYYRNIEQNIPPYIDHARIFKNTETGAMCLTYQPYREAVESVQAIEQWANGNELKADIYSPEYSWYYPGETLLIIIRSTDTEISLK